MTKRKYRVAGCIIIVALLAAWVGAVSLSSERFIDNALANQKIVFIMSVSSFENPYAAGYFVDEQGRKHIYELYERYPFKSIEEEYAYLLEHYDEFETVDFWDDATLRRCTNYLYHVNMDSEIRTDGMAIKDFPIRQLYGIRLVDGGEEFVWLGSETGISKSLVDPSSDKIFEQFGDAWYVWK